MFYSYFDGIRYIENIDCETVTESSNECKLIDCPVDYYYLHGACTKLCENITSKVCVDTIKGGNLFKYDSFGVLR